MTRDPASQRQVQAADPFLSTWLSANAGSGKTRVLIDRVARLLLDGVEPQRILCLTYTKAAASEMQNRLFRRLGGWAMLDQERLRSELKDLGVEGAIQNRTLSDARRLFARAIETPGGLRIQTIHSFCASLLRRFPLEAGVSPQFTELEDRAGKVMRAEILEEMAESGAPELVADLARIVTDETLDDLIDEIVRARHLFDRPLSDNDARAAFGLPADLTEATLLTEVFHAPDADLLRTVALHMASGSTNDCKASDRLLRLPLTPPDMTTLAALEGLLLTRKDSKQPFSAKTGTFPTKATRATLGVLADPLDALMLRVEAARPLRIALAAAARTRALHAFAAFFLPAYAARKMAHGVLDFDDLIDRARRLLLDPSVAQWVLFRLDGGIDHILVDEAQDTSPAQWQVIELLAQEFTTGRGARDVPRTIFVVGDKKQSIYSFQGADLEAFDAMRAHFRSRLAAVETHLSELTLDYSFRSSPAILRLVDLTFDERAGRDLGGEVKHIAFKSDMPGRVDLWPAIAPVKDPEPGLWTDPVNQVADEHHAAQLARKIAGEIASMIERGEQIPTDDGPRPITAGDVLILVQRRSTLFAEIIRACKAANLPIAGADRLKLGAELAVRDLTALLAFLATPEDDLSLAAVLRSPLFGWTEGQLFSLAQGRTSYLWTALRNAAEVHAATLAILHDLRDQADYLRPYDLIERALTRHDGRRKLLARLGDEAEDGIDALLSQALAYERGEIPSLTDFLGWLQAGEIDVKRQVDAAGGRIRVMTVHGAKGLESPIVILPETQDRVPPDGGEIVVLPNGTAVQRPPASDSPEPVMTAVALRRNRAAAESLRLLYVAMTRAQSWLIVAAAGPTTRDDGWYTIIQAGMERAGAIPQADGSLRLAHAVWPTAARQTAAMARPTVSLPAWVRGPVPPLTADPDLLSPSDLGGPKVLSGEADPALQETAKRWGTAVHLLLEHLPRHPEKDWPLLAERLVDGVDPSACLAAARKVLSDPSLQALFDPSALTEVPLTGTIWGRRVLGTIDRLLVMPDRVLAVDYKSNRLVPALPEAVPEGLLRQMGAYAAVLSQIYPAAMIETAILWTEAPRLMPLPHGLVMSALDRARLS